MAPKKDWPTQHPNLHYQLHEAHNKRITGAHSQIGILTGLIKLLEDRVTAVEEFLKLIAEAKP